MLVLVVRDYEQLSLRAAAMVAGVLLRKPDAVLGFATGETPLGLYRELARLHREQGLDFSQARTFNLDEYLGLAPSHPQSFRAFMQRHLFDHVNLQSGNIHVPDGTTRENLHAYCESYEGQIRQAGGIDLQVLGIGQTGHIGFNEPASSLASRTRVKTLTEQTRADNRRFFGAGETVPECAITMGIGTILEARKILLLASGTRKAEAVSQAIEGPITASVTASALQLHPEVTVIVDPEAAGRLQHLEYYTQVEAMTARYTPEKLL